MKISKQIKKWRDKKKLSVKEVSAKLNIPESTYRGYEYGTKFPAELVPKICSIFNISLEEFFTAKNHKHDFSEDIWEQLELMELCLKYIQSYIKRTNVKK